MHPWISRWVPTEEKLRAHPMLRRMAPLLRRPWLWQFSRRRVAMGVGIGVFFGFVIPVLQILGAAVFAILLRANLPVAAAATFVSNPLTFAPIVVLAYKTGAALLGEPERPGAAEILTDPGDGTGSAIARWIDRAKAIGKPLVLGLAVFAVVGGFAAWALVHAFWTLGVWLKRRRRSTRAREM